MSRTIRAWWGDLLAPGTLAIGVLYITIWPHELGHSVVAYLHGCKTNWWQTDVSWFLWDSWAGPVDYECLQSKGAAALGLTDFAGIGVNLILIGLALLFGRWWDSRPARRSCGAWVFVGTIFWALANYAEAFSYLILNTLWLSSDMKTVVVASGVTRWAWSGLSVVAAVILWRMLLGPVRVAAALLQSPGVTDRTWLTIFAGYVAVVSLTMGAARIVLIPPPPTSPPSGSSVAPDGCDAQQTIRMRPRLRCRGFRRFGSHAPSDRRDDLRPDGTTTSLR